MMAGLFGMSIGPGAGSNFFKKNLYWGPFYTRHLGEDHCGLSAVDDSGFVCKSKIGFFAASFDNQMQDFVGTEGIGYCGSEPGPFAAKKSKFGPFSIAFNGNILNRDELTFQFDKSGHIFETGSDAEIVANIIVQADDILSGINMAKEKIKGAYTFLLLSKKGLFAVRCDSGQWPLIIGHHKASKALIVSSESVGFNNLGFEILREVCPGEILIIKNARMSNKSSLPGESKCQKCSFYPVYTSNPAALVNGVPATVVRKKLGACLAAIDIANGLIPHIIIPVNDSGRFHGIGYLHEFIRQMMLGKITKMPFYDEYLIKYGFIRSFLGQSAGERKKRAYYKIVISAETIKDFLEMLKEAGLTEILNDILENERIIIVLCDDSVVRGTQVGENLGPKIEAIFQAEIDGKKIEVEIHVRASYPELLSYCPRGKTTNKGELLSERTPDHDERAKELGVASLKYNTLPDLFNILGEPKERFCYDCACRQE